MDVRSATCAEKVAVFGMCVTQQSMFLEKATQQMA